MTTCEKDKSSYIYLLHEREFINANKPIYKIGKTTQINCRRFYQYPKGSKLILLLECKNCDSMEKILINEFKLKFTCCDKEIGREYFEGNVEEMKTVIWNIYFKISSLEKQVIEMRENKTPIIYKTNITPLDSLNNHITNINITKDIYMNYLNKNFKDEITINEFVDKLVFTKEDIEKILTDHYDSVVFKLIIEKLHRKLYNIRDIKDMISKIGISDRYYKIQKLSYLLKNDELKNDEL